MFLPLFPLDRDLLNSFWIASRVCSTFASCAGWLTAQSFCGARRMRAPLAPPRLSEARNVAADAQAVETNSETDKSDAKILAFKTANILLPNQRMIPGGNRVLPGERLFRNERAEIAHDHAVRTIGVARLRGRSCSRAQDAFLARLREKS